MLRAGVLALTVHNGREAIYSFFRYEAAHQVCFDGRGPVLRELRRARTPTLLSEYGEITTLDGIEKEFYRRDSKVPRSVLDTPA